MTTTTRAGQLALDLPHRTAMTRADFLVGAPNESATHWIDRFPDWPNSTALLVGPAGAGKTHLGTVWQDAANARRIEARDLGSVDIGRIAETGRVLVEDLHEDGIDEAALFHLLNLVREHRGFALLTSRMAPQFALPDLQSRLRAALPLDLLPPDDDLLGRVMMKLFADRQLLVEPAVVTFLVRRIERSMAAAIRVVGELDQAALAAGRPISRQLAAEVLAAEDDGEPELPF